MESVWYKNPQAVATPAAGEVRVPVTNDVSAIMAQTAATQTFIPQQQQQATYLAPPPQGTYLQTAAPTQSVPAGIQIVGNVNRQ